MLGGRSTGGDDELQDKKADLELKYKKLQIELHELLDANEELSVQNKRKDNILTVKEKELADLTMRNALELEQLEVEHMCMVEELDHELEAVSGHVVRSELQKERYLILQQENDSLNGAIESLREELSAINEQHMRDMHSLNAFMKVERMRMENLFRSELLAMDMSYQNRAFLDLDDNRKQAMFANTKLKDELGLLSVGLSALGVRYEKDTRSLKDTKINLDDLELQGRTLQSAVNSLVTLKVGKRDTINQIKKDIDLFKQKKSEIDIVLHKKPSIPQLEKTLYQTDVLLGRQQRAVNMWKERRRLINLLKKEFKTATFQGKGTNFLQDSMSVHSSVRSKGSSKIHFGATAPAALESNPPAVHSALSSKTYSHSKQDFSDKQRSSMPQDGSLTAGESSLGAGSLVSIATMTSSKRGPDLSIQQNTNGKRATSGINLRSLSINDKDLSKGLKKLVGKESMLLDAYNENPETNVTAWTTAQIVEIFTTTQQQWQLANDLVEIELAEKEAEAEKEAQRLREMEEEAMIQSVISDCDSSTHSSKMKMNFNLPSDVLEKMGSFRRMGGMVETPSESVTDSDEDTLCLDSMDEIIQGFESQPPHPGQCDQDVDDEEMRDEPSALLLDIAAAGSYDTCGSATPTRPVTNLAANSAQSPLVRFKANLVSSEISSPAVDSTAPTIKAGSMEYYASLQEHPAPLSFSPGSAAADCDSDDTNSQFDKNGLSKSYSAAAVIQRARLEKSADADRRRTYVGFSGDINIDQLLAVSQQKINSSTAPNRKAARDKVAFQDIKIEKKINYLDGVEPPLASRKHLHTSSPDISKLIDPRCLKVIGGGHTLNASRTDSDLLLSKNNRPLKSMPSGKLVASSQNLNYAGGRESNVRLASFDVSGAVNNMQQSDKDPLSSKKARSLQKKF